MVFRALRGATRPGYSLTSMTISRNFPFKSELLILGLFVTLSFGVQADSKKSLSEMGQKIQNPQVITELFGAAELSKEQNKILQKTLKENQSALTELLQDFDASKNFYRGEIENEKTLNSLLTYLQLSILKIRSLSQENKNKSWLEAEKFFKSWFQFSADFPYEEASLVGLRAIGVVRSFLFDELESLQNKYQSEIAKNDYFRKEILALRSPWPIDRVVITESKKVLKATPMLVAEKLAKDLQKNPYQTSEAALKKLKGGSAKDLEFLKELWREKDIDLMKTEINRIGQMKLRLSKAAFEAKHAKRASTVAELISSGFLDRAPVDYKTGKPMELSLPQ